MTPKEAVTMTSQTKPAVGGHIYEPAGVEIHARNVALDRLKSSIAAS